MSLENTEKTVKKGKKKHLEFYFIRFNHPVRVIFTQIHIVIGIYL